MPTYAYRCRDCGHQFDIFQKFSEDSLTICPNCQGTIRRVIQPTGIVFKGTGFYINDSKNSSKTSLEKPKTATESGDAGSGESSGGDKPEKADKTDGKSDGGSTEKVAAEKTAAPKSEPASPARKDRTPTAAPGS